MKPIHPSPFFWGQKPVFHRDSDWALGPKDLESDLGLGTKDSDARLGTVRLATGSPRFSWILVAGLQKPFFFRVAEKTGRPCGVVGRGMDWVQISTQLWKQNALVKGKAPLDI